MPRDSPECGWNQELCGTQGDNRSFVIFIAVGVVAFLLFILITTCFIKRYRYHMMLQDIQLFLINNDDLESSDKDILKYGNMTSEVVMYRGKVLVKKYLTNKTLDFTDKTVLNDFINIRDLHHTNINHFVGVCNDNSCIYTLMTFESRGSVYDLILDGNFNLTWDFKMSILADIVAGLLYLKATPIQTHGCLTSRKCLINNKWVVRITGYGLNHIKQIKFYGSDKSSLLWTAPEVLRGSVQEGGHEADVYSLAIICQEVLTASSPYYYNIPALTAGEIIEKVKDVKETYTDLIYQKDHAP